MDNKNFFESVKREIGSSPEAQRFLSELHDHAEDASSDEHKSSDSPLQSLGEPKTVASSFHRYVFQKNMLFILADTIFVSIVSVPLFVGIFLAIVLASMAGVEPVTMSNTPSYILTWIVIGCLSVFLLVLLYKNRFPLLGLRLANWRTQFLLLFLLFFFPLAALFLLVADASLSLDPDYALISLAIVCAIALGSILFLQRRQHRAQQKTANPPLVRNVKALLGILTLIYILAARLYMWGEFKVPGFSEWAQSIQIGNTPILGGLFDPLFFLETEITNILIFSQAFSEFDLVRCYWLVGSLIVLLIAAGSVQLVRTFSNLRHERLSWITLIVVLFGITFLWATPSKHLSIEIRVPSTNISAMIERRQLGPFYRMAKYVNSYTAGYGRYTAMWKEGQFVIARYGDMNESRIFLIKPPSNIHDVEVRSVKEKIKKDQIFPRENVSPFECTATIPSPYMFDAQEFCTTLAYHGQTILSVENPDTFWNQWEAISDDGQWAIIVVTDGFDGAHDVYLLDLRGL